MLTDAITAAWHGVGAQTYELVGPDEQTLGTYRSHLPDITHAAATISGRALLLTGTGTIRRELVARSEADTDAASAPLASLRVSTLSWHGEMRAQATDDAESTSTAMWDLHRAPTLNLRWTVGGVADPVLVTEVRDRRVQVQVASPLLIAHPAVVALCMYLMQHHRSGSMTR